MQEAYPGYPSRDSKRRLQVIVALLSIGAFLLLGAISIAPVVPIMIRERGARLEFPPRRFFVCSVILNVLQFILPTILGAFLASPMRTHRLSELAPGTILAPLWRRGLAKAIDAAIILGPACVGQLIFILSFPVGGSLRTNDLPREGMIASIIGTVWACPWLIVYVKSESRTGRTIGKSLLGIRVLREDMQPCGFRRTLIRNLVGFIDAALFGLVGILSAALTTRWQRIGDLTARTIVIQDAASGAAPPEQSPSLRESSCAPLTSGQDTDTQVPGCLHLFLSFWVIGAGFVGTIGTLLGLLSLLIPGRVGGITLNGKPVETVGEKLSVTGLSLILAGISLPFFKWAVKFMKRS